VGGKATFAQGSYAMLLKDLRGDLQPGDQVQLSLFFEQAGQVDVTAEVR
jgi:copper(I)-binding protein